MAFTIPIPKELSHLKVDKRGYPVPFFVSYIKGEPEFRFLNPDRLQMIFDTKVCNICGKKLPKDYCYFISGPLGLKNCVATDGGMHRVCAEFSLQACPHIFFQKAQYRENDERGKIAAANTPAYQVKEKPTELFLVKVDKWEQFPGEYMLKFRPVSNERYEYIDGKLLKAAAPYTRNV